jgi:hypothetical protein
MTELVIRGIGLWAPGVPAWAQARALIAAGQDWPAADAGRPAPSLIAANERRRAPETVLLAIAVAEQACADAGIEPAGVASVFVSTYGDLAINHYMCSVLAEDPAQLSPTRFHNSVHNAPSGYWSIATGAMAPTTAIAASRYSFATALLESAAQIRELAAPVLLVAYDGAGQGPMAAMVDSAVPFGCALLLDAADRADIGAGARRLRLAVRDGACEPSPGRHPGLRQLASANPTARDAAALLEALARDGGGDCRLPLSPALHMEVEIER